MQRSVNDCPLVSIGMPVFNEQRFIRSALASLTAQEYPNLELIISDNASIDGTGEIAREFSNQYPWIRYHRFETNQGPAVNFKYVLDQAIGKYFLWAGGHDLWSANYISACVYQLEQRSQAIIAFGSSAWIDEADSPFPRESGWADTRGMDPVARYFTVLWGTMNPILGLIRLADLKSCPIINMVGTDLNILTHLAMRGEFVHATNAHWQRREFRQESSYAKKLDRYKSSSYALATTRLARILPLAQLPFELVRSVCSARLPFKTRCMIGALLLPTMLVRYLTGSR